MPAITPDTVAYVAARCRITVKDAAMALPWVDRHNDADHGGGRERCLHCQYLISHYGPMPLPSLLGPVIRAYFSYLRKTGAIYEKRVISRDLRDAILQRDGRQCCTCGATEDLTIDHIVAEKLGGTLDPANLQVLCRKCNSRKGARAA